MPIYRVGSDWMVPVGGSVLIEAPDEDTAFSVATENEKVQAAIEAIANRRLTHQNVALDYYGDTSTEEAPGETPRFTVIVDDEAETIAVIENEGA